ncbi:hypothetical protein V6Z11_A01G235500 [Gossypium hirsutum]
MNRNGIRVSDLRHMDTFPQKLHNLLSDVTSRFPDFNYTPEMLKEEVENYKRYAERLEPFIADTVHLMNESIAQKKRILVEGGQATMLDIDFGTYPFVTSSSPSAGGICTGLGIAPRVVGDLIGVVKAYTTRVGSGPFPTEILGQGGDILRFAGQEFGTTTGRPRRCGWLDVVALKFCCEINGFSSLNLTKLDVLSDLPEIKLGVAYKHVDGTPVESFPADLQLLEQLKVGKLLYLNSLLHTCQKVNTKQFAIHFLCVCIGRIRSFAWMAIRYFFYQKLFGSSESCTTICREDRGTCWCAYPLHRCRTWS